jgi:hypothetical protein
MEDWRAIASEARAGSAPAQYIVATAFEGLGDFTQVRNWYKRSASRIATGMRMWKTTSVEGMAKPCLRY